MILNREEVYRATVRELCEKQWQQRGAVVPSTVAAWAVNTHTTPWRLERWHEPEDDSDLLYPGLDCEE